MITSGCDNDALIMDNRYAFRFPKNMDSKRKIKIETAVLKKIANKFNIEIPKPIFISQSYNFVGYNLMAGQPLSPSFFKKFNAEQKNLLAQGIAKFLKKFHYLLISDVEEVSEQKELARIINQTKKYVFPKVTETEKTKINLYFQECKNLLKDDSKKVLTHGDFIWEHIFVDSENKKLTGIIDFSDMIYRDTAIDFAGLWEYGEDFVNLACENYNKKESEYLIKKSKLFYQRVALIVLIESQKSSFFGFEEGYRLFKKRFK